MSQTIRNVRLFRTSLLLFCVILNGAVDRQLSAADQPKNVRTDSLGDPLPHQALLRFGTRRFQHPGSVAQLLLSGDERVVATLDGEHFIGWDTTTGKELWRKTGSTQQNLNAAAYGVRPLAQSSQTGDFISTSGDPLGRIAFGRGRISLTNNLTGESQIITKQINHGIRSLDVSPDGTLIAAGDAKGLVVFDRTETVVYTKHNTPEHPLRQFSGDDRLMFGGDFSYARFSPDGKLLAMVNSEKPRTIQLFEAATGQSVREITGNDRIVRIDFSPNSRQIVATERDIAARLYNVADGQRLWEFVILPEGSAESYTSDVTFRPDGKQIAVGAPIGPENTIRLLDPTTGKETARLTGSGWKPWTLQYTKDSRTLYGSGWDGVIRRWDVKTNQQLPRPGGLRASAVCAMSRDGRHIAFVDDTSAIHIADAESGTTLKTFKLPDTDWEQVVFSHDGKHLAAGGPTEDKVTVAIWELATERKTHQWTWQEGRDQHSGVEALCFSANGKRVAAGVFRQHRAYVWDLPTNKQVAEVTHNEVYGLDLDADGGTLWTAGWDKHIREWDVDSGIPTRSHFVKIDHSAEKGNLRDDTRMYGLKLSNDQRMIATVDMTGSIRLFGRYLNPVSVITRAGGFTYGAVQFSRNDLWIGVGSSGGVQVFDVRSGARLWRAVDHEGYIYTVDFGAADLTILSGGEDGVCYLWDLAVGEESVPSETLSVDEQFAQLTGADSQAAFQAYHRFLKTPEASAKLLAEQIQQFATDDGEHSVDFGKWVTGLSAPDEEMVTHARNELSKHTLLAFDHLVALLESEGLSKRKATTLGPVLRDMSFQVRYLTELLVALDSTAADAALKTLRDSAKSSWLKRIVEHSQR